MHSGTHSFSCTATFKMNRQSVAVGKGPSVSGCEHSWLMLTPAINKIAANAKLTTVKPHLMPLSPEDLDTEPLT